MLWPDGKKKLIWRWSEFKKHFTDWQWRKSRRLPHRISSIPAIIHPLWLGFAWEVPLRQGFWREPITGRILAGFFESDHNFHYLVPEIPASTWRRSHADIPEPALIPLGFEEGLNALLASLAPQSFNEKAQKYLDGVIRHWRIKRDQAETPQEKEMAVHYIDAFQSSRVSLLGNLLPVENCHEL